MGKRRGRTDQPRALPASRLDGETRGDGARGNKLSLSVERKNRVVRATPLLQERASRKAEVVMTKFGDFAKLHVPGDPIVLFNAWDAGSAAAVAKSGAK